MMVALKLHSPPRSFLGQVWAGAGAGAGVCEGEGEQGGCGGARARGPGPVTAVNHHSLRWQQGREG